MGTRLGARVALMAWPLVAAMNAAAIAPPPADPAAVSWLLDGSESFQALSAPRVELPRVAPTSADAAPSADSAPESSGAAMVPELPTWTLLTACFAAMAYVVRRRRS